jgi:mycothiol synthase
MQLFMRRPSLEGLPALPALTSRFTLRKMTPDDVPGVAALLSAAFEDPSWTEERARKEFCEHPNVVATWLITAGKTITTTATTLLEPQTHPGSGCVHWVATDPAYRGQSLGYIASLRVLHDFVELGCHDAILRTDDFRLPAIKTYLKLGFIPEPQDDSQPARWEEIMAKLKYQRAD